MEQVVETSERQTVPFANLKQIGWLQSLPVSKSWYSEPVREEFSVAAGGEIVRRWKDNVNGSFQYEVFPGYIRIELAGIVIPVKEIRRLLEKEQLLAGDEVDIFVENIRSTFSLYRGEIENDLKGGTGRITELHPLMADLMPEQYGEIIDTITYATDQIFPVKKDEIRAFIQKYKEDLMTVKVVRKFRVIKA